MFDTSILLTEQGVWVVIALFYVVDNVKQLHGNKLVFRETWRFGWKADLPSEGLVFLHRHFVLLPVLMPFVLTMEMGWLTENPRDPTRMRRADRLLRVARHRAFSLRCISIVAFLTFFVIGPALTYWRGLIFALLEIAPIYVALLFMFFLSVFSDRRFWKLRFSEIIYSVAEAAVCPAYLVNLTHRLSWRCLRLDVDGAAYGLVRCSPNSANEFRSTIGFALEEMEQRFTEDPIQKAHLQEYSRIVLG